MNARAGRGDRGDVARRSSTAMPLQRALRVSTDTRTLEPGDTFLALRGERFDGHDFAAEARAARRGDARTRTLRGARSRNAPTMVVDRTLSAYMALAGAARRAVPRPRRRDHRQRRQDDDESVSERSCSPARYGDRVLAAPSNENNEIGVSKLLLSASNAAHDVVVVEMGARHYGDVAALVEIARPHVGILTNVGEAHLEIMGSRERLEETKWALFSRGARAVLNAADRRVSAPGRRRSRAPPWFAVAAAATSLEDEVRAADCVRWRSASRSPLRRPRRRVRRRRARAGLAQPREPRRGARRRARARRAARASRFGDTVAALAARALRPHRRRRRDPT